MVQTLRKYHVSICARKKLFSFQHEKSNKRKTKIATNFGNFFEKFIYEWLRKKHFRLILTVKLIDSFHVTNTVI